MIDINYLFVFLAKDAPDRLVHNLTVKIRSKCSRFGLVLEPFRRIVGAGSKTKNAKQYFPFSSLSTVGRSIANRVFIRENGRKALTFSCSQRRPGCNKIEGGFLRTSVEGIILQWSPLKFMLPALSVLSSLLILTSLFLGRESMELLYSCSICFCCSVNAAPSFWLLSPAAMIPMWSAESNELVVFTFVKDSWPAKYVIRTCEH